MARPCSGRECSKMVQQVKLLTAKPDNLSSVSGTHMMERKNKSTSCLLTPMTCAMACTQTEKKTVEQNTQWGKDSLFNDGPGKTGWSHAKERN